jgi:NuA3 HAT complex component NTO1
VEYDMDEQDQEWLSALNAERRRDGIDTVSYEFFEIVMDKLEKEWFDLVGSSSLSVLLWEVSRKGLNEV